jgi:hypothetical protein
MALTPNLTGRKLIRTPTVTEEILCTLRMQVWSVTATPTFSVICRDSTTGVGQISKRWRYHTFFKTWTIVQHRIGVIQQFVTHSAGTRGKAMGSPQGAYTQGSR